jgi:hypothetical protein
MSETSQIRALKNYRQRLSQRGMARFEVLGLDTDRELIRSLARKLAESGPEAKKIRTTLHSSIKAEAPKKGGILAALRRSPMAEIKITREFTSGRKIDL